jgi:hypothetical protein
MMLLGSTLKTASIESAQGIYETPPLRVVRLLFELWPTKRLYLPVELRSNVLRGAFGTVFQRTVCQPDCPGASLCPRRETCAYAMLFEPKWRVASQDFGAADAPRAFLFRSTRDLDPNFGPNRPLRFELRLFGQAVDVFPFFINTFQTLARCGLDGVPFRLASVQTLDWQGESRAALVTAGKVTGARPFLLRLDEIESPLLPQGPLRIDFLTPTWLRYEKQDQPVPTLPALVCRLRDRLSFLSLLYEEQEWIADYAAIAALAAQARILGHSGQWLEIDRDSSRTGQTTPLDGFLGWVVYDNVHPALWRLLAMGQEVHAGRHAVWGNGAYRLVGKR